MYELLDGLSDELLFELYESSYGGKEQHEKDEKARVFGAQVFGARV